MFLLCFFVTEPATTENNTYWPTLSLHGALPSFPANRYAVLSASSIHAAASGANNRNASTTVRSASPKAVHLRASRSTFSHHAVIHHDASPAAIAAAGAMLSEAPALRCHDDSPAPLSMPMATYASTASTPASAALAQARPERKRTRLN